MDQPDNAGSEFAVALVRGKTGGVGAANAHRIVECVNACASVKNPEMLPVLVSWARANVEYLECRSDQDCDHCMLVQVLGDLDKEGA